MTRREDEQRERIRSVEGQLVKAAIMVTEARERAEAAERALLNRIHEYGQLSDENLRLREALAEIAGKAWKKSFASKIALAALEAKQ